MLLAHLIPSLDAEIDRLQQARDLLAYVPPPFESAAIKTLHVGKPSLHAEPATDDSAPVRPSEPVFAVPASAPQSTPKVLVLKPHRRGAERAPRRRLVSSVDTALRGAVPAGPVVVSAQAVRQAQESKVTQGGKAAADHATSFDWRPRASDKPDAEALLLRKLLDIGNSDDSARGKPSEQLLRFMHS